MEDYNSYIQCPQCGYPVPIVSPDCLLHDNCPLCDTDLTGELEKERQSLNDSRLLVFLKQFFNPPRLITREELRTFLNISTTKMGSLVEEDEIEGIDLNPSDSNQLLRFTPHQVLKFLEEHSTAQ